LYKPKAETVDSFVNVSSRKLIIIEIDVKKTDLKE